MWGALTILNPSIAAFFSGCGDDDRDLIGIGSVIVVVSMIMTSWCWGT
jgi:hypothetical protein